MNELAKIGFIYDVNLISKNGEIIEKRRAKNLIVNEGITCFLKNIFTTNMGMKCYAYGLIETDCTIDATDTITTGVFGKYGANIFETTFAYKNLENTTNYYNGHPLAPSKRTLITETQTGVYFPEGYLPITSKKTITGVFLIRGESSSSISFNSTIAEIKRNFVLISAAKFDKPLQVFTNSTFKVKSTFQLSPL